MIGLVAAVLLGGVVEDAAVLAIEGKGNEALKLLATAKTEDPAARFVEACVLIDRGDFPAALKAIGRLEAIRPDAFEAVVLRRLIVRRRDVSFERWTESANFAWHDGPRGPAAPLLVLIRPSDPNFWSFGWPIAGLHAERIPSATEKPGRLPALAIVEVETSPGDRIDARLRARDGGELWSTTRTAGERLTHLGAWVPRARGHVLNVSQRFVDGGTCLASGLIHADEDPYPMVQIERRLNGTCRVADLPAENLPVGDFPPHPAP